MRRAVVATALAGLALTLPAQPALALTEGTVLDFVRAQAAQKYQVDVKDVHVSWQGMPLAMIAPTLPDKAQLKLGSVYTLCGTMPVPIEIWSKGRQVAMIFPDLNIDVWESVVVSTSYVQMGTPLTLADLKCQRRLLSTLGSQAYSSISDLAGAVALRDIPAGQVLTTGMAAVPPLVHSGAMVNVSLIDGGLSIQTTGQALQDGRRGQVIRVLNPVSSKDYMGVVTGSDEVVVHLEGGTDQ